MSRFRWTIAALVIGGVLALAGAAALLINSRSSTRALPAPGAHPDRALLAGFGEVAVVVKAPDGRVLGYCLLHAETVPQHQRGLMAVTDLHGYEGMVFSYAADTTNAFYMRNTPMPLSIVWLAVDGSIVSTADMAPCADVDGCKLYPPAGPYRSAIEAPQGTLGDLGIVEGSKIEIGGSCT